MARLAGLPGSVIERAQTLLANLEGGELDERGRPRIAGSGAEGEPSNDQPDLFQSTPGGSDPAERDVLDLLRRSAQTAMYHILDNLTRLIAPVLRNNFV